MNKNSDNLLKKKDNKVFQQLLSNNIYNYSSKFNKSLKKLDYMPYVTKQQKNLEELRGTVLFNTSDLNFANYKNMQLKFRFFSTITYQNANRNVFKMITKNSIKTVLVTGGGAFNQHLISLIESKSRSKLILPSKELINFKEALIFAFLGYLRLTNQINTLASVTGAKKDSIGAAVYFGE